MKKIEAAVVVCLILFIAFLLESIWPSWPVRTAAPSCREIGSATSAAGPPPATAEGIFPVWKAGKETKNVR